LRSQANSLHYQVSTNQDTARLIAERVARRLAGDATHGQTAAAAANRDDHNSERLRARVINFIAQAPPARTPSSIGATGDRPSEPAANSAPRITQSPWLAPFSGTFGQTGAQSIEHPSQERFGVEEATVSELVEFFENEKQCSVDPSGKPCDHCAMCSSRGF